MLKKYLPFALALCCSAPLRAALVTGFFKNAAPGDRVEVYVPHFYLDGKSGSYWGALDGQLQFRVEAQVPRPQLAFVVFGEDKLPVFLEPNEAPVFYKDKEARDPDAKEVFLVRNDTCNEAINRPSEAIRYVQRRFAKPA